MERERWLKVERLYHAARELEGSERARFLREACAGDEALLREVESLLAEEGGTRSLLGKPALEVAAQALARDRGRAAATASWDAIPGRTLCCPDPGGSFRPTGRTMDNTLPPRP